MTQNTSSAVMQQRGTSAVKSLDFFPTPPWAARAGGELIAELDPAARSCWEPACGAGHMAWGLADYFAGGVYSSDIHAYGAGDVLDFLGPRLPDPGVDWIVTNPPFVAGEAFARTAFALARRGVALLLRVAFLEGAGRFRLLYGPDMPLAVCAPFAERVPMVAGRWDPAASSATCYAWFVWLKDRPAAAGPRLMGIPPGTRARLSRRADLVRFASGAGPLL
jgi:hypothetical protein